MAKIKIAGREISVVLIIVVLVVCIGACGLMVLIGMGSGDDGADNVVSDEAGAINTATFTATPPPSATPLPTDTPAPTNTPTPTATPTPLPEPVNLSGTGDSVVDFEMSGLAIAHITGNQPGRHFSVTSYDNAGNRIDLLVNTTDPYDGYLLLNTRGDTASRMEVTGTGDWAIDIEPLNYNAIPPRHALTVPGTHQSSGTDVIILAGETPDLADVSGNQAGRHFAITSYGASGNALDLLVNTTDPYEGTVILDPETRLLQITAVGEWNITINEQ
jgi:hypothetical protein